MSTVTLADRLARVNARTKKVNPARVIAMALLGPFLLVGWVAFWAWFGLVWAGSWAWNGVVEGYEAARERAPRARR